MHNRNIYMNKKICIHLHYELAILVSNLEKNKSPEIDFTLVRTVPRILKQAARRRRRGSLFRSIPYSGENGGCLKVDAFEPRFWFYDDVLACLKKTADKSNPYAFVCSTFLKFITWMYWERSQTRTGDPKEKITSGECVKRKECCGYDSHRISRS